MKDQCINRLLASGMEFLLELNSSTCLILPGKPRKAGKSAGETRQEGTAASRSRRNRDPGIHGSEPEMGSMP